VPGLGGSRGVWGGGGGESRVDRGKYNAVKRDSNAILSGR
jgi:hypothetical protein